MDSLEITQPDDWHLHLRDGSALALTVNATARVFARAIVMPNLTPPVTTTSLARDYHDRIMAALAVDKAESAFQPLMTLYLTDNTRPGEVDQASTSGLVHAVKFYPAGVTTNADAGVSNIEFCHPVLERMQALDLPLLVHGEVNDPRVDVFDREAVFLEQVLGPLLMRFPKLRVVLEHITTEDAVKFVEQGPGTLAATITPHHLLYERNHLLAGGIRPHYFCLPILKRARHQQALLRAASSGNPKFFLGTDSAPHSVQAKESACGCAGIYTAHAALELYAEAFDQLGRLDRLEGFASHFGADFYRLPHNTAHLKLVREPWRIPDRYPLGESELIPLRAGEELSWRIKN